MLTRLNTNSLLLDDVCDLSSSNIYTVIVYRLSLRLGFLQMMISVIILELNLIVNTMEKLLDGGEAPVQRTEMKLVQLQYYLQYYNKQRNEPRRAHGHEFG
jgi:ABC-type protease/lipase transport system fused ATPase/permease subunit